MLLPHDSDMINKVKNYIKYYTQQYYIRTFRKRQLKILSRSGKIIL
jgi:transketolase C-terminal domain/subunit